MSLSFDPHLTAIVDQRQAKTGVNNRLVPFASDDEELRKLQMCSRKLGRGCSLANQADNIAEVGGGLGIATGVEAQDSAGEQKIHLGRPDLMPVTGKTLGEQLQS